MTNLNQRVARLDAGIPDRSAGKRRIAFGRSGVEPPVAAEQPRDEPAMATAARTRARGRVVLWDEIKSITRSGHRWTAKLVPFVSR